MAKIKDSAQEEKVTPNDLGWNDYVLGLLSDDEKIDGNPTVDGLRRIFEIALDCVVIQSTTTVAQSPDPNNEKRATVVHSITYAFKKPIMDIGDLNTITVDGAADVYWGNCDKIYRNHPVAVAETRAEGRALRRALKLRKVVAAEELTSVIDDDIDPNFVSKISANQINFIDTISKRLNINVVKLLADMSIIVDNIHSIGHQDAVKVIRELSKYQQTIDNIPEHILEYDSNWR
jgi:hypothetical protein